MKVNTELIDHLSDLSKLEFRDEQKDQIKGDLENILGLIEKLDKVDTSEVQPLIHMLDEEMELREDEVTDELSQEEALKNARHKDSDYIKVPKFLRRDQE